MGLFGNIIPWFKRGPALNRQTVAMEQLMKGNALWGANPDTLVTAVTAYHSGNIAQLAKIVDAYERQDDVAATGRMKRDASVARCEHTVLIEEGHEDDPRAQLHRETLQRFWATIRCTSAFNRAERGGIRLLKKQMMSARTHGWSAHNILWHTEGGTLRAEFVQIPMWHFENLTGELRFREHVTDWYGVPLWDGGWLVNSATPIGPAVALACCAKRMSLQDWMLFSERAATPGLLGKTTAANGTEAWNNLCEMLNRWSRAWVGAVDKDTDITPVNLNTGTPPMPQLVERMDRAIAALYRGADLSTISKGEGLGASLQGEESDMLEADQCAEISEALHEQVDRLVIRYECGDDEPLAYIWIEPVSKPDVESNTKIDNHLASFGIRLSKRDMLQRYGRAEAADDSDALEPPAQGGEYGGLGGGLALQTPPRGLPNAQSSCKGRLTPLQNARKDLGGRADVSGADAPEAVFRAFAEAVSEGAKPLAEQVQKLLDLIDAGKEAEAASFAASLSANLASYLPEDPESATVLAEAMAERYGQAWEEAHAEARRGGGAKLANETDANGAEHAPAGSGNGGQFVSKGAGGSSAPSGTTEPRIRAVKSSPKADAQARSLGYSDIRDMMAKAETVEAERVSAIQKGFSGKCKAHEAVAVIAANKPFEDAEGNKVDFGKDILEHYIEGRRRRDNEPKVGNLEDLPYAIKAVKSDTYGVTRLKYPRGATPDPINPPRGTQREYHLPTERGQMKVFVYIQGGHINGWHVEQ